MHFKLTLALTLALATAAVADCPSPDDLGRGIVFTRQDGRTGIVSSTDGTMFTIDYAASEPVWTDKRLAIHGVFETFTQKLARSEIIVGVGGSTQTHLKLSGKPPIPVAGGTWQTRIRSTAEWQDGTEFGAHSEVTTIAATYQFLQPMQVTVSGCDHTVVPVEATFAGEVTHTRRWLYFPTLGFGLETRVDGVNNGLTSLKENG